MGKHSRFLGDKTNSWHNDGEKFLNVVTNKLLLNSDFCRKKGASDLGFRAFSSGEKAVSFSLSFYFWE